MAHRIAIFPGSFDPVHNGHLEVLEGATRIFDEVVMATFETHKSDSMFSLDERLELLREATADQPNVKVTSFNSLVVELARETGAVALVRGLRAVSDFESELQMAQMNNHLAGIETVFIPTSSEFSFLASRLIREVARYGGDVKDLVPPGVAKRLTAFDGRGQSS